MEKLKLIAPLGFYGILIGLLYSFAFWDRFSINPLEFASILDIAKVAAWPLTASVLVSVVYFVVSGVTDEDWRKFTHADASLPSVPPWLKFTWKLLWMGGTGVILYWLLFGVSTPVRWFGIGFCVVVLVASSIEKQTLIRELIPSHMVRVAAIILVVLTPFTAIGAGATAGESIKSGKGAFILDASSSQFSASFDTSKSHAFVGVLGNLYIFYSNDQTVSLIKLADGQMFSLQRNPDGESRFRF